jgi:hypothetical protein
MRKSTFRGDLGRKRVLRMRKSAYLTYCLLDAYRLTGLVPFNQPLVSHFKPQVEQPLNDE